MRHSRISALLLFVAVIVVAAAGLSRPALAKGAQKPAQQAAKARQLSAPDHSPPARTEPLHQPGPLPERWRGIIRRVALPAGDRRVALTFDLCERAVHVTGYDAPLVEALRQAGARATFFAGGKWLRSHPEAALSLMADERFELGNHAWTHANMAVVSATERKSQILRTSAQAELLREELEHRRAKAGQPFAGPRPLALFRLPYGRGGADVAAEINNLGLAVIQWDIVGEGGGGSVQARAKAMAEALRPGAIVLLHANLVPRDTAALVRALLPLLRQKGLKTATVTELLTSGAPETVPDGYFSLPGDNRVYDAMFEDGGTGGRAGEAKSDHVSWLTGKRRRL